MPARVAVAPRERAAEEDADTGRRDDAANEREHDAPASKSDVEDEELRPEDPEDGDAQEVREAGEPQDVRPARQPPDRPEDRDAQRSIRTVQRREPENCARGHDVRRRIARPFSPSQTGSRARIRAAIASDADDPPCVRIESSWKEEVPQERLCRPGRELGPAGLGIARGDRKRLVRWDQAASFDDQSLVGEDGVSRADVAVDQVERGVRAGRLACVVERVRVPHHEGDEGDRDAEHHHEPTRGDPRREPALEHVVHRRRLTGGNGSSSPTRPRVCVSRSYPVLLASESVRSASALASEGRSAASIHGRDDLTASCGSGSSRASPSRSSWGPSTT